MTLFTLVLDLASLNAYSLYKNMGENCLLSFKEFKRSIAESVVANELVKRRKKLRHAESVDAEKNDEVVECTSSSHVLVENIGKKDTLCYLCNLLDKKGRKTTIYGCVECKKGFHVNCFAAYHFQNLLRGNKRALASVIRNAEDGSSSKRRKRANKRIGTIAHLTLQCCR